jgi:hypothetical protein
VSHGSTIPDPGFADDDGAADPRLAAVLAAWVADEVDHPAVLEVLQESRLLVPVVAVAGEVEQGDDGLAREKSSDMATVLVQRPDGRRGMLAFTGAEALAAWDDNARPVPVSAATAAEAALQERADALVVDIAGPARYVVRPDDLAGLAGRWRLTRVGGRSAWIRPAQE